MEKIDRYIDRYRDRLAKIHLLTDLIASEINIYEKYNNIALCPDT